MKKIYICNAYYHVLITLLKEINNKNVDIILSDSIPKYKVLGKRILNKNIINNIYYVEEKKINLPKEPIFLGKIFHFSNIRKAVTKHLNINFENYDDIIIYNDWTPLGYYLSAAKIKYILYEDGLDLFKKEIYTPFNYNLIDRILGFLNLKILSVGESKYIKEIEVNDIQGIAISKKNIKEVNRIKLMEKTSKENKKLIYDIFIEPSFNLKNKKNILILTEPLFLDRRVKSESDQISLYRNIIKEVNNDNYNIYIKPHPRDLINYERLVSNNNIIDKDIPIEVLNFNNNVYFEKAIAITSTSIDGIKFVKERIKLGNKFIKSIY